MHKLIKLKRLKMSKRSEIALDKTIKHWIKDIKEKNQPIRVSTCPLCRLYNNDINCGNVDCCPCPINVKVKGIGCGNNEPLKKYERYYKRENEPKRKRLAQNEIDFLQTCYY